MKLLPLQKKNEIVSKWSLKFVRFMRKKKVTIIMRNYDQETRNKFVIKETLNACLSLKFLFRGSIINSMNTKCKEERKNRRLNPK